MEVLNNWGSTLGQIDDYLSSDNPLDHRKVNIVYGGNMGDAQDILSLIDSIDYSILGQRALMLFIGYGDQFEKIKNIINKNLKTKKSKNKLDKPSDNFKIFSKEIEKYYYKRT